MEKYVLKDLISVKRGMSLSGEYYSTEGDLIRLTLGNFQEEGGFKINTSKDDLYFTGPVKDEFILAEGDIITPLTEQVVGLLGATARIPESGKYIQSGDVALIKCISDKIDDGYCYYLISSDVVRKQLSAAAQQTKIRHTSPEKIMDCEVFIPEVKEQRKVAKLLDGINKKIELNNKINDNLFQQALTMYDYWFTQFDFPDSNGKPYKTSGGSMYYCNLLGKSIPLGWNSTTVSEICVCHDSKRVPLASSERQTMQGNYPYYGATEIMDHVNRYIFDGDYVLLAEDGSIMDKNGHPVLQRISGKCWVNNHAHILEPISGYSCFLLFMLLKDIPVVKIKTGSIQSKITQANLNSYSLIEIPSVLRERFISITAPIDKKLLKLKAENESLIKLRNWLLPMLMSGQATIAD